MHIQREIETDWMGCNVRKECSGTDTSGTRKKKVNYWKGRIRETGRAWSQKNEKGGREGKDQSFTVRHIWRYSYEWGIGSTLERNRTSTRIRTLETNKRYKASWSTPIYEIYWHNLPNFRCNLLAWLSIWKGFSRSKIFSELGSTQ